MSPMAPVGYIAPPGFTASTDPNLPRVSFRTVSKIYLPLIYFFIINYNLGHIIVGFRHFIIWYY